MSVVNVVCSNIIEQDGKILFVKESKKIAEGRYSLPAGKLEFGESLIDGAIREAKEETGLDVEPVKLIGIYQRPSSSEDSNTTVFCFLSKIISGNIQITDKHPEVKFLTLEEISNLEKEDRLRSRYMIVAVKDYFAKQGVDLSFLTIIK